jgi:hypothetical protein
MRTHQIYIRVTNTVSQHLNGYVIRGDVLSPGQLTSKQCETSLPERCIDTAIFAVAPSGRRIPKFRENTYCLHDPEEVIRIDKAKIQTLRTINMHAWQVMIKFWFPIGRQFRKIIHTHVRFTRCFYWLQQNISKQ